MSRWGDPGQDRDYTAGLQMTHDERPRLCHCASCPWAGDFTDAIAHFRQTDHAITYRGHVQNFEKYRVTASELEARR